jgi:hypothetical protein
MEQLAFENYKSFIATADCVREVSAKIVDINAELDRVVNSLPSLVVVCEDFCEKAGEWRRIANSDPDDVAAHQQMMSD